MAEGQKAADQTKGFVKGLGQMSEDLRKNVNSFADNIVSSDKNSTTGTTGTTAHGAYDETRDETRANRDIHDSGLTGHNATGTASTTGTSGDIHPDAKKLGGKIEQALDPDKHKTT